MTNTLPIALTRLLEYISTISSVSQILTHVACWATLTFGVCLYCFFSVIGNYNKYTDFYETRGKVRQMTNVDT